MVSKSDLNNIYGLFFLALVIGTAGVVRVRAVAVENVPAAGGKCGQMMFLNGRDNSSSGVS
jgi:hypothetical protein